jgi:hypothetical protein
MATTRSTEPRDSRDAEPDLAVAAARWRSQIAATAVACLLILAAGAIFQWTDVRAGLLILSHVGVLVEARRSPDRLRLLAPRGDPARLDQRRFSMKAIRE